MTTKTMTYGGTLVATSCWCGIGVGVPSSLYQEARRNHHQSLYCPLGHSFVFSGKTEEERLRQQLKNAEANANFYRDQLSGAERSLAATRGVVTRIRNRAHAGACPFGCRRNFANLQRHVATKHPGQHFEGEA